MENGTVRAGSFQPRLECTWGPGSGFNSAFPLYTPQAAIVLTMASTDSFSS